MLWEPGVVGSSPTPCATIYKAHTAILYMADIKIVPCLLEIPTANFRINEIRNVLFLWYLVVN